MRASANRLRTATRLYIERSGPLSEPRRRRNHMIDGNVNGSLLEHILQASFSEQPWKVQHVIRKNKVRTMNGCVGVSNLAWKVKQIKEWAAFLSIEIVHILLFCSCARVARWVLCLFEQKINKISHTSAVIQCEDNKINLFQRRAPRMRRHSCLSTCNRWARATLTVSECEYRHLTSARFRVIFHPFLGKHCAYVATLALYRYKNKQIYRYYCRTSYGCQNGLFYAKLDMYSACSSFHHVVIETSF